MIGCYMDKNPRQDMPGGDFLRVPGGYMLYCSVILLFRKKKMLQIVKKYSIILSIHKIVLGVRLTDFPEKSIKIYVRNISKQYFAVWSVLYCMDRLERKKNTKSAAYMYVGSGWYVFAYGRNRCVFTRGFRSDDCGDGILCVLRKLSRQYGSRGCEAGCCGRVLSGNR